MPDAKRLEHEVNGVESSSKLHQECLSRQDVTSRVVSRFVVHFLRVVLRWRSFRQDEGAVAQRI